MDMIEQTGTTGTPETEKKYQPSGWLNNYARLPASPCNQRFLPSYFSGCPLGTAGSGRSLGVPSNRSGSDHLRIDTTAIVSHRKCSHPVEKYCRCCACTFFSFSRNTDIMIICTVLMFQAPRQLRQKHWSFHAHSTAFPAVHSICTTELPSAPSALKATGIPRICTMRSLRSCLSGHKKNALFILSHVG